MADFRSWLVLGRVSNLSTVWANGLCAWILGEGTSSSMLTGLLAGISLIYLGGMYLNDFFDVQFDQRYRPERPIPSGKIQRSTVLVAAIVFLLAGLGILLWLDENTLVFALVLIGLVVIYNAIHKHTIASVPVMAACRTAVYLLVAAATPLGLLPPIAYAGILMFFYVLGITALARTESTSSGGSVAAYAFLAIPMVVLLYLAGPPFERWFLLSYGLAALWMAWTFFKARTGGKLIPGKTIGPLLAGICLIDLAILNSMHLVTFPLMGLFLGFFLLAMLAQRYVPAT